MQKKENTYEGYSHDLGVELMKKKLKKMKKMKKNKKEKKNFVANFLIYC